jgi:hypothetical protein
MSIWDTSYSNEQPRDRWNSPCYTCGGGREVVRTERVSCGCLSRCSPFCDRKQSETVSRPCSTCNGTGIRS